ncbi:MAG: response regulator [Acidobacteria bacterium]|nr:response regulator [Acidobacteriota bacterium]
MTMQVEGRTIERVLIVDDDPRARTAYGYSVEDLGLEALSVEGPVESDNFFEELRPTDALVCDYHLRARNYSTCEGDELLNGCFKEAIPGVLCSALADVFGKIRRDYLRCIPARLASDRPDADALVEAWRTCILEMRGEFEPKRRPWRALVRVADVEPGTRNIYVVVPAFHPRQKIPLDRDSVPDWLQPLVSPGRRFHAQVNIGADCHEEMFFDSWEDS